MANEMPLPIAPNSRMVRNAPVDAKASGEEPRAVAARVHDLPVVRQGIFQRFDHVAWVEQPGSISKTCRGLRVADARSNRIAPQLWFRIGNVPFNASTPRRASAAGDERATSWPDSPRQGRHRSEHLRLRPELPRAARVVSRANSRRRRRGQPGRGYSSPTSGVKLPENADAKRIIVEQPPRGKRRRQQSTGLGRQRPAGEAAPASTAPRPASTTTVRRGRPVARAGHVVEMRRNRRRAAATICTREWASPTGRPGPGLQIDGMPITTGRRSRRACRKRVAYCNRHALGPVQAVIAAPVAAMSGAWSISWLYQPLLSGASPANTTSGRWARTAAGSAVISCVTPGRTSRSPRPHPSSFVSTAMAAASAQCSCLTYPSDILLGQAARPIHVGIPS